MKLKYLSFLPLGMLGLVAATLAINETNTFNVVKAASIPEEVHVGDTYEISPIAIEYKGEYKKSTSCVVTTPKGYKNIQSEIKFSEAGRYTLTYSAMFNDVKVEKDVYITSIRRPVDLFTTSGATLSSGEFKYDSMLDPLVGTSYKGVRVDTTDGAVVTFNKIIDVSNKNKNEPFIDFIVEPKSSGNYDIGEIIVTLTDAEDPDNSFSVRYVDGLLGSGVNRRMTYVTAWANDQKPAGYESGFDVWHYNTTKTGMACALSVRGLTQNLVDTGGGYLNTQLSFVDDEMSVYCNYVLGMHSQSIVNDLNNTSLYGANIWNGFKSGKAIVSIKTKDVSGTGGIYIIHSIGGYDLSVDDMKDDEAPSIDIDYGNEDEFNLPKSKLGAKYPIFKANVDDNLDDNLKTNINVTYYDEKLKKDIDVYHDGQYFTTNNAGVYTVKYSVSDYSGNYCEEKYVVTTVSYIDDIVIEVPIDSNNYHVFDTIKLCSLTEVKAKNGSGYISVSRSVVGPEEEIVEVSQNNTFKATSIGTYKVIYEAVDIFAIPSYKVVDINVLSLDHPVFTDDIVMPERFIYGFTYDIPQIQCKYSYNKQLVDGTTTVKVNGEVYNENTIHVESLDDYAIEFIPNGDDTNAKKFNISVISPNGEDGKLNKLNYFYSPDGEFSSEMVSDGAAEFSVIDDSTIKFANVLSADNLTVEMQINQISKNHFSTLNLVFTDAVDPSKKVTLKVYCEGETTSISMPCSETKYELDSENFDFTINYNSFTYAISDYSFKDITNIKYYDDGSVFEGFSRTVYFSFNFENAIAECRASVIILNNQSFKTNVPKDNAAPQIVLNSENDWGQEKGTTIIVGDAVAYDVLSYIESLTLSVTTSDGTVFYNEVDATKKYDLLLDKYGDYSITYTAIDGNGKKKISNFTVCCIERIAPTISVPSFKLDGYKAGDTFTIPTYSVTDNSDTYYMDVLLYQENGKGALLQRVECIEGVVSKKSYLDEEHYSTSFFVDSNSFKFVSKGTYRLRFHAYDSSGNIAIQEFTISVAEGN